MIWSDSELHPQWVSVAQFVAYLALTLDITPTDVTIHRPGS